MATSTLILFCYGLATGISFAVTSFELMLIIISGLCGIAGGDYFLFKSMQRLGPRRAGILFAANAPIAGILGWILLGEILSWQNILAIFIGFIGIVLAVVYGKRRDLIHAWENITPPLWLGVMFGLLAAVGQGGGVLLMRPVMEGGFDPIAAAVLRAGTAALVFWAIFPVAAMKNRLPAQLWPSRDLFLPILGNSILGLALGMVLLLKALEIGSVAMVTILAATSPMMLLPFVWAKTRLMPPLGAWIGAALIVLCSALLIK
jgi:drug/metabolite transporter (DMT)-like permease